MRRLLTALASLALVAGSATVAIPASEATGDSAVQAAPAVLGTCYDYSIGGAVGLNNPASSVACKGGHTAETFYVGTFSDSLGDPNKASEGSRLALTAKACSVSALNDFLGMPDRTLPSRFAVFTYYPTTAEWKAGERWFRCDAALRLNSGLDTVKGSFANIGDSKRFDYCTPGSVPNWRNLRAEVCNDNDTNKTWLLVAQPRLGSTASAYPKNASSMAQSKCKTMSRKFPGTEKSPKFYYTFPGSLEWTAGIRTSNCFIPLQQYLDSVNPSTSTVAVVGDCFAYKLSAAYKLSQTAKAVACTEPHTAQTFITPQIPEYVGDPTTATEGQRQTAIQNLCSRASALEYLGITETTPARFDVFAFFPGSADYANGVTTFHCDVVFLAGKGALSLTQTAQSFAQTAAPVDLQYCSPSIGFAKTPGDVSQSAFSCNQVKVKKYWINVRQVELTSSKATPSIRTINKIAKKTCASVKTEFKGTKKKPSWYYTYPDPSGWSSGNRTARCWVPLKQYQDTINPPAPEPAPAPAPVDPATTPVG